MTIARTGAAVAPVRSGKKKDPEDAPGDEDDDLDDKNDDLNDDREDEGETLDGDNGAFVDEDD